VLVMDLREEGPVFLVVVLLVVMFGLVNGIHDAGNAIAVPIVTGALRPGPAVFVAAVFHMIGALVMGTAVAATVAGIAAVPAAQELAVLGAAVLGALVWNVVTLCRALPCSSGHCLVGALAGSALAEGGKHAVHWGGLHGLRPEGVIGSLLWLVFSSAAALPLAMLGIRVTRRTLRRASRAIESPIRRGEVVASAGLAFAHGSNDAQKTMGLMTMALVAGGHLSHFAVPFWVMLASAVLLTVGTMLGGWRVVRTLGRRIYHLRSLDGLVSQSTAGLIVVGASLLGAPVSTTDVVAPAIVGVGSGERWRHVRWAVAGEIGLAWLVTLPVSGALGALFLPFWRWVG
jgi:PiT family inorganic phosphate transporter